MKLWVDDERPSPGRAWNEAKTSAEAILILERLLESNERTRPEIVLEEVSLDHDLGMGGWIEEDNGFKVLDWMIENQVWPLALTIHTANPPARERMLRAANAEAPEWVEISVIHW